MNCEEVEINLTKEGTVRTQETLTHLKLMFPKYEAGKSVSDWIQYCE